jgi:DNA-nicking Smr family endonuclease
MLRKDLAGGPPLISDVSLHAKRADDAQATVAGVVEKTKREGSRNASTHHGQGLEAE